MKKSPLNYLITSALGAVIWVVTAIFYGGSFSESLMLAKSTPEVFLAGLRLMLGIAAGIGIINCLYWFYYGGLDSTAGSLGKAKNVWWISFIFQLIVSVVILAAIIFQNLSEGLLTSNWLMIFGLISLHTWLFFWLNTFLLSPRNVENIPLFK